MILLSRSAASDGVVSSIETLGPLVFALPKLRSSEVLTRCSSSYASELAYYLFPLAWAALFPISRLGVSFAEIPGDPELASPEAVLGVVSEWGLLIKSGLI